MNKHVENLWEVKFMFCAKCGNQLDDQAVICPRCGCPTGNFNNYNFQNHQTNNTANVNNTVNMNNTAPVQTPTRTNVFGIISLILGILSMIFIWFTGYFGFLLSAGGIALGIVGITRKNTSRGMAITGLVLSAVSIAIFFFIAIIIAAVWSVL